MNSAHKSRLTIPSCRFVTTVDLGRKGAETRQSNIAHYGPTHAHAYDYSKSISSCCFAIRGTLINSDAQIRRAISAPTAAAAVGGPIVGTLLTCRDCVCRARCIRCWSGASLNSSLLAISPLCTATPRTVWPGLGGNSATSPLAQGGKRWDFRYRYRSV